MEDAGHRSAVEAALKFEKQDRTPVNNFALVTASRSAGYLVKDTRFNPEMSARVSVDYAMKTKSDFVKPILDSQMVFADLGMDVSFADDDYGRVRSVLVHDAEEIDDLAFFDPNAAKECPNFDLCIMQALRETARIIPEDLHICGLAWGPITTAGYLLGVENLIMDLLMEGDLAPKLIDKSARFVGEQQVAMGRAGQTLMWMADPTASEDIIAPDMFHFAADGVKTAVSMYKKEFANPAFLHICGNTKDVIPMVAETGADCLSFDHAVDPAVAKAQADGKIALMGNIDPVKYLMMGTPEQVTEQSYRVIRECGMDSGLILAPGCETPISSPDANVIAMGDAGRNFWKKN
ncbi:Uroporphyrinogen-III decarboxylase [Thermoplasmatales archaeon BRNA1]|nr:Uroporphyrinogen-III decarboxylase [Thermoplasmatales archaeon BRNA1]